MRAVWWRTETPRSKFGNNNRVFIGDRNEFLEMEEQLALKNEKREKLSLRQRQKSEEQNKWEINRMVTSGV